MAKTRIFISHSCKDAEIADGVPFEAEQDPRLRRLKYVRILRDELVRLMSDTHEVLLDRALLDPGDSWPIKLLRWLGDCDGAVLLLSEDAIKSKWVLQEATVLTWRRRLREDFKLIPALLGGLQFDALEAEGFGPLQVNEIQAAKIEGETEMTRAEALALAAMIAKGFSQLAAANEQNDMQLWLEHVAAILSGIEDEKILGRACKPLHISADDWAHYPDRALTVAHYMLRADLRQNREALEAIKGGIIAHSREAFVSLANMLMPLWVDPSAAAALAEPPQKEHWQTYAINTDNSALAADYAQRAWCSPAWWGSRFIEFNEHIGEGQAAEAAAALRESLALLFDQDPLSQDPVDKEVLRIVLEAHPFFVALGDDLAASQTALRELLHALAQDDLLRAVTFIQLAGDNFARALPQDDSVMFRIRPQLNDQQVTQARANKILLAKLSTT